MSEQEIYQSILEKMLIQTEQKQINSSEDFIKKLTQELRSSNVINAKF
ncbi:hypothetical protein ACFOZ1_04225 [Gracilibacillus marinus]|uniref:Sporulation histidine kinase inhibitor Sda n=1 Tax=Gracilibacillus marinus TaxID=630535 RepID=A0ABV8VVB1_9BACI